LKRLESISGEREKKGDFCFVTASRRMLL